MPKLEIVGWRRGVLTISAMKILKNHLSLNLKEAYDCVNDMVGGTIVSFPLGSSADAEALRVELEEVGVIVQIEPMTNIP